jgi:hypothetical protein
MSLLLVSLQWIIAFGWSLSNLEKPLPSLTYSIFVKLPGWWRKWTSRFWWIHTFRAPHQQIWNSGFDILSIYMCRWMNGMYTSLVPEQLNGFYLYLVFHFISFQEFTNCRSVPGEYEHSSSRNRGLSNAHQNSKGWFY